jgi:hypothetical protein
MRRPSPAPDLFFERLNDLCGSAPAARKGRLAIAAGLREGGTPSTPRRSETDTLITSEAFGMGRGLLLWLIGIPLPVILLLYFLGFLN